MKKETNLLTDTDAAIYLGITKELLYAYVRNAPKKCKGDTRRLSSIVIGGQNYFKKEELDNFDAYLKEPWSDSASQRPPIPSYIKDYLKIEIQGKCPISGFGYPLEDAHISPYCESLNHHHHNIIRISGDVHTKIDSGIISRDILSQTKKKLIQNLKQILKENTQLKRSTFDVPNPNPFYIGREELIRDLVCAMSDTQLVVIEGIGGIGKSQLLIQAINSTVEYYNPVVWIDIEQVETFADFLMLFSNAIYEYYKVSFSDSGFEVLQNIQITFVLDSLEKLLINEKDDIEDFITELLSKCPTIQLLITSQIDLSLLDWPLKVFKLQGLNDEESISLIYTLLDEGFELENSEINWILQFSNGHPLTLKLISTLIKYYQSAPRVIELLKESGKVQHPTRQKHNKSTSLSVCLNTIYDILNDDQKKILHFLKFYPGGAKLNWIAKRYESIPFYDYIAYLKQFFFIENKEYFTNIDRIAIANPIRSFLQINKNSKDVELNIEKEAISDICKIAFILDMGYIETGILGSPSLGIIQMEYELPNLLLAYNSAKDKAEFYEKSGNGNIRNEYLKIVSGIASSLGKFCFVRSYYKEGITFAQSGIEAYNKLKNYVLSGLHCFYLAQIQAKLQKMDDLYDTIQNLKSIVNITDEFSTKMYYLWTVGWFYFNKKENKRARRHYQSAINILQTHINTTPIYTSRENLLGEENLKATDLRNLQLLKCEIAKTYEIEEDYEKAIVLYKEVIDNFTNGFSEDNKGGIYLHYAQCLSSISRFEEAINFYHLSIENFIVIGHIEYLSYSIANMGSFIEDYPESINHAMLDQDVIFEILNSLTKLLSLIPNITELDENYLNQSLGEDIIVNIIKAIGFSQYSGVLCEWVSDLLEEIPVDLSKPSYFGALINLAHCVGGVDDWKNDKALKSKVIKSILQCCLIINGGPDLKSKTRIFYWLAKWIQFTKLQSEATAENLWDQAWNSFDK